MGDRSTTRLVAALLKVGAPDDLVAAALQGAFHDFKSPSATPIIDLVQECERHGLSGIAAAARAGEFDATREEADEWAASADGQATFRQLIEDR
jgi:hypothetical protein